MLPRELLANPESRARFELEARAVAAIDRVYEVLELVERTTRSIDIELVKAPAHRSEDRMTTITISPKFQIVIPKAIRDLLDLRPGQKIQAIAYEDRIELIPARRMKAMRGLLRGIDTAVERDPDRV